MHLCITYATKLQFTRFVFNKIRALQANGRNNSQQWVLTKVATKLLSSRFHGLCLICITHSVAEKHAPLKHVVILFPIVSISTV